MADEDFDRCDHDEHYVPVVEEGASAPQGNGTSGHAGDEDLMFCNNGICLLYEHCNIFV